MIGDEAAQPRDERDARVPASPWRSGSPASKATYTWPQVAGAAAIVGIGFTMSLFIAGASFAGDDFAAAKIAIFAASLVAGVTGVAILWSQSGRGDRENPTGDAGRGAAASGSPVALPDPQAV
jgi:hypothetical protein